jgi:RimJ/RimL family protein N-acetyltransferase
MDAISASLRALTPADAPAYRALRLRALAEFPEAFTSSAEEESASTTDLAARRLAPREGEVLLGAFVGATLAGTVGLERKPRDKERHKAWLYGMFVAPEHGGRAIGRQLLDAAIAHARAWPGVEQITLSVTRGNERAHRLYDRAGFVTFGVEQRAIKLAGEYLDKEHMVLFLGTAT